MTNIKYLTTSWGDMAYTDSGGSGYPLLFLHGTGCSSADWLSVIEYLPPHQRHITLDFRGHGKSNTPTQTFTIKDLADDVLYLVDSIGIHHLILVGHSLGGMVAMEVARNSTCAVGLVLLEGWTNLSSAGSAFDSGRFYGSLSEVRITEIQHKSDETRNRFYPEVWSKFWKSVKEFDAYDYLKQACIPIYEIFGGMGKNESTEKKLSIPPNSNIKTIWVPNAGHYLPHECPAHVGNICIDFVETYF